MILVPQAHGRLEIGATISSTFSVVGRNIGRWASLAVVLYALPMLILRLQMPRLMLNASIAADMMLLKDFYWAPAAVIFANLTAILLLQAALARGTIDDLNGDRPSLVNCFSATVSALVPVLGCSVLAWFVAVTLGYMGGLIISSLLDVLSLEGIELAVLFTFLLMIVLFITILLPSCSAPSS
jgi:hypothetical protein